MDKYGGSFENRIRFMVETAMAVRSVWSEQKPLFARIALTDWLEGGWSIQDALALASALRDVGVDLIDGVSGAIAANKKESAPSPLMQVPLIRRLRQEVAILTGCNFGIETADQADGIVKSGAADVVVVGRAMLRDPYWARHAADALNDERLLYANQYEHWLSGRTL